MAVNVQARGGGGIGISSSLNLQNFGPDQPAVWTLVMLGVLLLLILLIASSLR